MDRTKANFGKAVTRTLSKQAAVSRNEGVKIVAVDELSCMGKENSQIFQLEIVNTGGASNLVFGTPIGIADEYDAVPQSTSITDIMFDFLATLADQGGAGLPTLQLFNKRAVRHALYISHIEVITPNTALGNSQKSQAVRKFIVPINFFYDSSAVQGAFIPQFTEYTAVTLLNEGAICGEYCGFIYKVLENSSFNMNIHIAAVDSATFRY